MIDTHAHCQLNAYKDDMDEVIKRSLAKETIFNLVGTQFATSKKAVEVAEKYDGVYASVALHPEHLFSDYHDEGETAEKTVEKDFDYEKYRALANHPKVIAIGECGLDLYRIPDTVDRKTVLEKQQQVFLQHVSLAKELSLPLSIHCRDAHEEMIEILGDLTLPSPLWRRGTTSATPLDHPAPLLRKEGSIGCPRLTKEGDRGWSGVMHCYTSDWQNAEHYLNLGLYLGFTGVITFPPHKKNPLSQANLLEVIRKMPQDRILIETDCPYLAPIPYRGQRGEPWMVEEVAKKIAELRRISLEEVIKITTNNALRLFTKMKAQ